MIYIPTINEAQFTYQTKINTWRNKLVSSRFLHRQSSIHFFAQLSAAASCSSATIPLWHFAVDERELKRVRLREQLNNFWTVERRTSRMLLQIDTLFLALVRAQRAACRYGSIRHDPIPPTFHSTRGGETSLTASPALSPELSDNCACDWRKISRINRFAIALWFEKEKSRWLSVKTNDT